ncbi:MAG TPA: cytochrome c3 family protein [Candidatus Methanoperedens sp.]|nr:cytochrome c3 family protein [Candidatus Methanoperedens sp.]
MRTLTACRRRRGTAWLALALLLLPCAAFGQSLSLDKATEKETEDYDKPNPHFELDCSECHDGKPDYKVDTAATVKFRNGDEGNVALCLSCHDPSDNLHPIDVDPAKADPVVKVPKSLPLERAGAHAGQVVCSTCHFIHTKTAGLKLLRGFPESSLPADVKKAQYKDRRDLCRACHGERLKDKSPHKGKVAGGKSCSFCHPKEPKEGEKPQFSKAIIQVCDFCHAATKGAHYLLVNPFADPNLKDEVAKANLPMIGGGYNCVSCHNPHGGTGLDKYMRPEFVQLALKSRRVRPHFLKAFCEACHTVKPTVAKGQPGAQKLSEIPLRDTDMNALCNRCHESGLSKANAHPLRKITGDYLARMPKEWPLGPDGGLTCLTCHTAGDSPVMDPDNVSFLRGAPYESRNGMCWKCHTREEFSQLNPHEKVNNLEGCEFCHDARPDLARFQAGQKQDVKFKGDIVILCIRCHDDNPHPGSADHTGTPRADFMKEKQIAIPKSFPLDRLGRVTCATCHNPHAEGALRGDFSGMMVCPQCHKKF